MKKAAHENCRIHGRCGDCCTTIENLSVTYDGITAVDNVSFKFHCGELTALVGLNGAGKSSILKAVLGQVKYTGSISHCSATENGYVPRIGYVPQRVSIPQDSPVSVCDLMLVSSGYLHAWMHVPPKKKEGMRKILALVSAENLIDRKIGELSGGELQRVLLACSINPLPDILLLDEPVSAVDVIGIDAFYEIICDLRNKFHMTIIVVTHDISTIARHADKMLLMNRRILLQGTPAEVLKHPDFILQMGDVYLNPKKKILDTHKRGGSND